MWTAAPSGWGFTGTIAVTSADVNCCPTAPLASQPFLPITGWNRYVWNVNVGSSFVITIGGLGENTPMAFTSDRPAAGPTGPAACGFCYPATRVNHSYYYGTINSPLCPGMSLHDGTCAAQWLMDAQLACQPVSLEESSFGSIKGLYR